MHKLEPEGVGGASDPICQLARCDFLEWQRRFSQLGDGGVAGFDQNGASPIRCDGEIPGEVVIILQVVHPFPQGCNGRAVQVEADVRFFPGADSRGNSDCLRRT